MNLKIAVYDDHDVAVKAIELLRDSDFPIKQISLLGKMGENEKDLHLPSNKLKENIPVFLGMGAGTVTGLLTGLGVFAIPGFGVLYGAGAIIGTLAGLQLGVVAGGILPLLATAGIESAQATRHSQHLEEGKYLIFLNGSLEEIERAEKILHTQGTHLELS
jgi:hypothetical protein